MDKGSGYLLFIKTDIRVPLICRTRNSMATTALRVKVIEEIQQIPEDKLGELYDVLHFFRIGLQQKPTSSHENTVMAFAGCWEDMADEEFDNIAQ